MKWMLVLGFLVLAGCVEEESSAKMPNRVVISGATGESGAALFRALDRMARLDRGVTVEIHDREGIFEMPILAPTEDETAIKLDLPRVEVLFQTVAFGGQQVSDEELEEKLKAFVAEVDRLHAHAPFVLEVSAIESSSSADAVKYLRLVSECGVKYCSVSGHFLSENAN